MTELALITKRLDTFFEIKKLTDPSFSKWIPELYSKEKVNWQNYFEKDFNTYFNGLMMQGSDNVKSVFASVFPTEEVLTNFIKRGSSGDLLFLHHPLHMLCGDPKGAWGKFFVPIPKNLLDKIKKKKLSVYSCHAPLDYNKKVSTSLAIVEALDGKVVGEFFPYGNGNAGLIYKIKSISTKSLIEKCKSMFGVKYVDFEGKMHDKITKVATVGGCGDVVKYMKDAESHGVHTYLTGEIHTRVDNDYGRKRYAEVMDYVKYTKMSLIGVSHAASEYFVMKTQIKDWFKKEFNINIKLLPMKKWWC